MRILWVATKPPAPPADGGRLLQLLTLEALVARGALITLVAPADAPADSAGGSGTAWTVPGVERLAASCTPRLVTSPPRPVPRALLSRSPYTIARHRRPEVAAEVERLLAAERFDVVHAEQLQALPQAEPAFARGVPVVLRAQNVESDLWRGMAGHPGGAAAVMRRAFAAREARRLAAWEGRAAGRAAVTVALTAADAARLAELAERRSQDGPAARIERVPAPFPVELPAGEAALPGEPAVVLLGSGGWPPNREAARWFIAEAWPAVRAAVPGAALHRFDGGPAGPGVVPHPPPADSRAAFAPGAVFAVPLAVASGVRMKILEAWARGLPVVASPAAAAGLDAEDGRELLLAEDAAGFAAALARFVREPGLAQRLVAAGRAALAAHHDPAAVAVRLLEVYRSAGTAARPFAAIDSA